MHNGVCASVHVKSRRKPSNSCQNRSKRRRFPSKRDQKRAHFVMPILTFGGATPSGASARADFAFRKGKKGAFWRRKMASGKVIHNSAAAVDNSGPPRRRMRDTQPHQAPIAPVARLACRPRHRHQPFFFGGGGTSPSTFFWISPSGSSGVNWMPGRLRTWPSLARQSFRTRLGLMENLPLPS